jgi:hypothetical protein
MKAGLRLSIVCLGLLLFPHVSSGGIRRLGSDFQLSPESVGSIGSQGGSALLPVHEGKFLAFWEQLIQQPGELITRLFDKTGSPVSREISNDLTLPPNQCTQWGGGLAPSRFGPGDSVIITGLGCDAARHVISSELSFGVLALRLTAEGERVGDSFFVNTQIERDLADSRVSGHAGGFIAVWYSSVSRDTFDTELYGRRFDQNALPVDETEFRIHSSGFPLRPEVAAWPDGRFIVVWYDLFADDEGDAALAQIFDASGQPIAPLFVVNTFTAGEQREVTTAILTNDQAVVVWGSGGIAQQDGSQVGIFAQIVDRNGAKVGPEMAVNTYTLGVQRAPQVVADPQGGFLVLWNSEGQDGDGNGVYARRFTADGSWDGSEFRVSSTAKGDQFVGGRPAVFSAPDQFFVTWTDFGRDGSGQGVFAQRFEVVPRLGPMCGDAVGQDLQISAGDALAVLRAAVGRNECALCVCDFDGSETVTSSDALAVLQWAVGVENEQRCSSCPNGPSLPQPVLRSREGRGDFPNPGSQSNYLSRASDASSD